MKYVTYAVTYVTQALNVVLVRVLKMVYLEIYSVGVQL